jgi:hypothetical protein
MAARDTGDGAIAGIITGIIMGVITILLALAGLSTLLSYVDINAVFGGLLPMAGGIAVSLTAIITLFLFLAIVGLILGAIYGAVFENIPTTSAITKGVAFMLAIWAIFGLFIPIIVGVGARAPGTVTAASIISALIAAVIWGALLGLTFIWVSKKAAVPGGAPIVRP